MARVLIVDDDDGIRESFTMALEDRYEVVVAVNGEHALEVLETTPVDLIILDLMMPVLDGEGFLAEYRQRGFTATVVISSAGENAAARAAALGVPHTLPKPVDLKRLLATVHDLVTKKQPLPAL